MQLVLSLFPGIGLLDMAFEEHGFSVVRGPDLLWGGDIRDFHPPRGRFDGVIGGPPCQAFSRLVHMVRQNGYEPKFGDLFPEFARCVNEADPDWFLIENVPTVPADYPFSLIASTEYRYQTFILNNRQLGEKQNRVRRFWWGAKHGKTIWIDVGVFEHQEFQYCGGDPATTLRRARKKQGTMPWNHKGRQGFVDARQAQGLPDTFELPPFKVEAACHAIRNGVPLAMGRALAKAIKETIGSERTE